MRTLQFRTVLSTTLLLFTALLPAAASAQENFVCPVSSMQGAWGYTETGALALPTGATPFAAVGKITLDSAGNAIGTQTSSLGGRISQDIVKGTFSLNPDCTGTMSIGVYDQSGTLLRTIGLAFVLDDNAAETRAVVASLSLPNGVNLPAIITLEARRVFPRGHNGIAGAENQ